MLNSASPIPLYHQLADILTEQIRSGEYKPGDVIPSEIGMAKSYHIGRPTVRQAMDILVRKGLLERKRGSGTFVKHQDDEIDLFSLAGTSQAFFAKGIKTKSTLINPVSILEIKDDILNPFNDQKAYFLSRLTLVKDDPILLENIYLHPQLFMGLEKIDLENKSLSSVVLDQYYLKPQSGRQTFKISMLPKETSHLLSVTPKEPLLEVQRVINFPNADNAIFSRMFCRTEKFAFSQTISHQCI
jgi:DNA-binding GntR family transcriptional regulator